MCVKNWLSSVLVMLLSQRFLAVYGTKKQSTKIKAPAQKNKIGGNEWAGHPNTATKPRWRKPISAYYLGAFCGESEVGGL